jgi:hypothetical protein
MTLLLLALVAATPNPVVSDILADAERAFALGVEQRNDSELARPTFARAAAGFDELWHRGFRHPMLARQRGRAKRLAGDLGGAIAAYHEGLAASPYDRPLQADLAEARAAVAFPHDGVLAAQCQPQVLRSIRTRMSPADAFWLTGVLWVLTCAAVARFAMTRGHGWLLFCCGCILALLALGVLWWHDAQQRERYESRPLVVLREDTVLRKGNTDLHPPRLDQRLPRGVEARVLLNRGGWVQVELACGVIGWLPESSVVHVA